MLEPNTSTLPRSIYWWCSFTVLNWMTKAKNSVPSILFAVFFCYTQLATGIKVSPDIAQSMITEILAGLNCVSYIYDWGIWTDTTFEEHMELVGKLLSLLLDAGMKWNPLKYDCAVEDKDLLAYWMTPNAVKPMENKVNAVLKIARHNKQTEARSFIGVVCY